MWLINTSYGWNPGDDLIRDGVLELLGIQEESKVFVNRGQVDLGGAIHPIWKMVRNMSDARSLAAEAKGIVVAGSPEWYTYFEEFYQAALEFQLPVYLVGIGMRSPGKEALAMFESLQPLIKGATVRDKYAASAMQAYDIPYEWFPDPAFSAPYPAVSEKKYGLVVNYRAGGGNGEFTDKFDERWRQVSQQFAKEIDLVTVHEMGEYKKAKLLFPGKRVFFSSDYVDYKKIYASTARYIGGRVHGATPVVATGGTAHVLYNHTKVDMLRQVATFTPTLTVTSYDEEVPYPLQSKETGAELGKWLGKHKAYWESRV